MKQISFLQDIFINKDTETFLPCLNEFHLIDIIKEGDYVLKPSLLLSDLEPAKGKKGAFRPKAPSRGLWVPCAGSLWHKRAGVATL